jgi:hypothetical protein
VKRLGVELLRERAVLPLVEPVRAAHKPLSDPQVFEGSSAWWFSAWQPPEQSGSWPDGHAFASAAFEAATRIWARELRDLVSSPRVTSGRPPECIRPRRAIVFPPR